MTSKGAIIDIGAWLRGHGLGQYEATFRQNEIEVDILPELTEPDFEKLGIPLGHRKRLLKAIANLEATERSATAFGPASAPPPPAAGSPMPEAAGERRHVTVMFCDLVDSTGIAAKLDAEEWRDLVGAAFAEHPSAPRHRVGPAAVWRQRRAGGAAACRPGEHSHADQARSGGECPIARAAPRRAATEGTCIDSSAGGAAATAIRGADRRDDRERKGSAVGAGVRGLALGRSDDARCTARPCRAWCAGALVHRGDAPCAVGRWW
jgi:SAM domain (Sterile alpha motif)